jgi:hypothetical protein
VQRLSSAGILANADGLHLFGIPVVLTNACSTFVSTTVSGPILANLGRSFVLRRVESLQVQVTNQVATGGGDFLGHVVIANARYDVKAIGQTAAVVYSH